MSVFSEEVRAFLNEQRFAVLATINADGSIQQTTMWYLLEENGDTIMMNTQAGRLKERNLRRDPRVSLCFEDGYRYVTLSGTIVLNDDQEISKRDIYRLALRYIGDEKAAAERASEYAQAQRVTLLFKPERVLANLS
jgi:PPOX class probable F420-dependent enzyme